MIDISGKCSNWADIKASGFGTCTEMKISGVSSGHYWTKTLRNSCYAFRVGPAYGDVYYNRRSSNGRALCEERG